MKFTKTVNASKVSKTKTYTGKTPPGDKNPGIDPEIHFYGVEDGDNTA